MRVHHHLKILFALSTLATMAACASTGRQRGSSAEISVQWDSGPLDRAYQRERSDMDARHSQESASPRSDESSDQRGQRQSTESKDLESRYSRGKASHSQTMPSSER
jgi:hypothetical protein